MAHATSHLRYVRNKPQQTRNVGPKLPLVSNYVQTYYPAHGMVWRKTPCVPQALVSVPAQPSEISAQSNK
jgi:hypothetical protein